MGSTWHERFHWEAADYFGDQKVIKLCQAIEADDVTKIDEAIKEGADVNAKGKGNMTPLMWAFPDNKLNRFKYLLKHGADPNVVVKSDFETHGQIMPGDSVTHLACDTSFPGYFDAVFNHGGNPNLLRETDVLGKDDSPLFSVIVGLANNKRDKVKRLIEKGADLNYMNASWATPAMQAISWGGQYDIALMILDAGADWRIYVPKSNSRLVHILLGDEQRRKSTWAPQQKSDFEKLVKWLKDHGESFEQAEADRARWKSWNHANGEYRWKMDAEIATRESREKSTEDKEK